MDADIKQTIIVRSDLGMGRGKMAAQASHASVAGYIAVKRRDPETADRWVREGMKKIVLKVGSESELMGAFRKAKETGLPAELIHDAGLTQIESGSATCFSIGPASAEDVDKVVGGLKLL